MLKRLNEEIKRRALVARIFPHVESCLRLTRALYSRRMKRGVRTIAPSTWIS